MPAQWCDSPISMLILERAVTKFVANGRSPASPERSNDVQIGDGNEERRSVEAAIDPLSQVCAHEEDAQGKPQADSALCAQQILQRTNTSPAISKLRAQNTEPYPALSQTSLHDATPDRKHSGESPRELSAIAKTDKK